MPVAPITNGDPVAYDVTGSGPPIVLIHGLTENRTGWDPLVPGLADDHAVMRLDLPGHGDSGRADSYDSFSLATAAGEAIAAAGIERPLVVGHSLGGTVATILAATMPVRGVVNVDQPLALGDLADSAKAIADALRGDDATFRAAIVGVLTAMEGRLAGDELARVRGLRRPEQDVVLGVWAPLLDGDAAELDEMTKSLLAGFDVPYLTLLGEAAGDYRTWLAEALPHSRLEEWPGVGHYPHLVHPDRFVDLVRDFETTLS